MTTKSIGFDIFAKDRASAAFDKIGKSADGLADKVKGAADKANKALAGLGLVGGAALGAGIAESLNLDAANDKLAAQLGATPKQSARFGKIAGKLYAGAWGDSMEQVNEGIRSVVQNIDGMKNASAGQLKSITGNVLTLATTFDADLGGTTRAISQLMRTGLAKNAKEALDLITVGFQNGTNKADDLLDTFNEYGTVLRDVGLSGKDALGLMSQGLKAGARDADTVADALKEFAIRAQDGSVQSAAGFRKVGLNAKEMTAAVAKGGPGARKALDQVLDGLRKIEDPAKRNAAAVELFGTKAEDLGDSLFALDLDTAATGLGKVDGATKKMSDTVNDNALTAITSFKRGLEQAFVQTLGGKVIPFMTEHKTLVITVASVVGILAGGILAANVAMKVWTVTTKVATAATKVWAAGQWLLNAALTANPIGLVVAGVAALAAGVVIAYKKSETFRGIVDGLFKVLKPFGEFIGKVLLGYIKLVASAWLMMGEFGVKAFRFLLTAAFATFGGILDAAAAGMGWIPGLGGKIKGARDAFKEFGDKTITKLKGVEDALHRTRDAINGIPRTINIAVKYTTQTAPVGADSTRGFNLERSTTGRIPGTFGVSERTTGPLAGLVASVEAGKTSLQKAFDKVAVVVERAKSKLSDLMSQRSDLAGSFGSFTSSAFSADLSNPETGAGPTAGSLVAFQRAELAKAQRLKQDVRKLIKMGLSKDLIQQLAASGESGIAQIHALAAGSQTDVARLNSLNAQTQAALDAAGMSAGNAVFGTQIDKAKDAVATALEVRKQLQEWRKEEQNRNDRNTVLQVNLTGRTLRMSLLELKRQNGGAALGLA